MKVLARIRSLVPKKFERKHVLILIVLGIATFLRFYNVANTVQFLGDQGRDALIVSRIFRELDFVFIGPVTSVGNMYLGPLYYYFMVPFLWLTYPSPMGPVYAIALLGVVTVFLMYHLGKKFLSERVALIAATLFGLSAVVAQNTRFSWNPNPAPFVSLLLMYFTFKALQNVKYWIAVVVCFAVLIQLHYMTLLAGAAFWLVWLYQLFTKIKEKKPLKKMFTATTVGVLIFLLSLTPLVLFDIKHDGLNKKAFINILTKEETFAKNEHEAPTVLASTLINIRSRAKLILTDLSVGEHDSSFDTFIAFSLIAVLFYIVIRKFKKGRLASGEFIVFSFLITGIIGTALYRHNIYHHYIAYLFPAAFFSLAIILDYLYQKSMVGKILVGIFSFFFIQFNFIYGREMLESLGWTIANIQSVAQTIEDRVKPGEKYNIVLLNGTGDLNGQNYRYFLSTSDDKKIVSEEEFGQVETLFIIDEERKIEKEVDSPVYEIVVFPNKKPVEVYTIPDGPEITMLRKEQN